MIQLHTLANTSMVVKTMQRPLVVNSTSAYSSGLFQNLRESEQRIGALLNNVTESWEASFKTNLRPLKDIFRVVSCEKNETIKKAMKKSRGYFERLFSNESWEEWRQSETAIGRVIKLTLDYAEGLTKLEVLSRRLDSAMIIRANQEAIELLRGSHTAIAQVRMQRLDCSVGLVLGGVGSLVTQNILPIGIASMNCFDSVAAQQGRNPSVSVANRAANRREQILAQRDQIRKNAGIEPSIERNVNDPNLPKLDLVDQIKHARMQLAKELAEKMPQSLKRLWSQGTTWIEAVISGVSFFVLDVTQIMEPHDRLVETLSNMETYYWLNIVYPRYVEIFRDPRQHWDARGNIDPKPEIAEMREKLKHHGYNIAYGTPLEFLEFLRRRKICERSSCPR